MGVNIKRYYAVPALVFLCACGALEGIEVVNYYSPRNAERPKRRDTYFIILHTTEGPSKGSLQKVWDNGETHYFIDVNGKVYRIISRDRVAFHSGRSMWNGRTGIDDYSIGIEMVGYYNRNITAAQYTALKELLQALQKIYNVPDSKVLTHSMVAYGAPNRWHNRSHRGRKRCGMLFAQSAVRTRLGLSGKPAYDPDVRAGRLVNADPYLASVLYARDPVPQEAPAGRNSGEDVIGKGRTAWDIARGSYNSSDTLYIFPDGKKLRGNEIRDWQNMPAGTVVVAGNSGRENEEEGVQELGPGAAPMEIAGDEYRSESTIYILPDRTFKPGSEFTEQEFGKLPRGTRVLVGYTHGGTVTAKRSAFMICGKRWNFPTTYYLLPDGVVKAGNMISEREIPPNTEVFYRR